ncbi:MAG: tetratricopeptide repeat protein [Gammaproteobacteria bacterium]|nr:tetratricopeptide repeat protein [Gammaproteobacteria bacterium]
MAQDSLDTAARLFQAGHVADGEALVRALLRANPSDNAALGLLGRMLARRGDYAAALDCLAQASATHPRDANLHLALGDAHLGAGDAEAAAAAYSTATALSPGGFEPLARLGGALTRLGRFEAAADALQAALQCRPDDGAVLATLAGALQELGRSREAEHCARRATAVAPGSPEAWINLGVALHAQGRLDAAATAYEQVLAADPGHALGTYNLGHVLAEQWRSAEALENFRRAVELDPGYEPAWHAWLFHLLYDPAQTEATIFTAHQRWGQRFAERPPARGAATAAYDRRRLRVGYVSADFRSHSCAWFLLPLFAAHDRAAIEVTAYSGVARPDEVTQRFRARADRWREIRTLNDAAIAQLVRDDGIDILVDLGGHTMGQPLGVFALRPAPVQVAWLGYPATTGLSQIDYRITDPIADPPGAADRCHTERLLRLPGGFLCYQPPDDAPQPAPPPLLRNGYVTFGSFNNIAKITPEVVATWSALLGAVPGARLLLKGRMLAHAEARQRIRAAFAEAGTDSSRLQLMGWLPRDQHPVSLYAEVDIALDTYPYNGTTTTCEALWMGVPVVTLRDERHAGRVGASILTHLGRREWIAGDADQYLSVAQSLAADPARLAAARRTLRPALAACSLTDAAGFARRLEQAFRDMLAGAGRG